MAETPLDVPESWIRGEFVHRTRPQDWSPTGVVDLPNGPVGDRRGRPVDEVAAELGCGWHTVNNEVVRWGEALLEADTSRVGEVQAVGVDKKRCCGGKAGGGRSSGVPLSSTWEASSRFDIVGGRTAATITPH